MRPTLRPTLQGCSVVLALAFAPLVLAQKIETFDADPTQVQCQDTLPTSINDRGDVTGICSGAFSHGFVRSSDGHTVIFDAPNANGDTRPTSSNDAGDIVGIFTDVGHARHGFLRDSGGDFIFFDAPNSSSDSIWVAGINDAGEITGSFFDPIAGRGRSFVRDAHGRFIVFDAPAPLSNLLNTESHSINRAGDVAGTFAPRIEKVNVTGFLRDHNGNTTTFVPPNAARQGLEVGGINARGEIVGTFRDATSGTTHGYIRDRDGTFTVFDSPTGDSFVFDTNGGVNGRGDIAGAFLTPAHVVTGFLRNPEGEFVLFSPSAFETLALGINNRQEIVGAFLDGSGRHGFIAHF